MYCHVGNIKKHKYCKGYCLNTIVSYEISDGVSMVSCSTFVDFSMVTNFINSNNKTYAKSLPPPSTIFSPLIMKIYFMMSPI